MIRTITTVFLIGIQIVLLGQDQPKKILFIGNSYTAVNDLPLMFYNLALSTHDTIEYSSNTPGGATFNNHTQNSTTLSKIMEGKWDYVVLQEQSQLPSFPESQVENECLPYAHMLDSIINQYNPCVETVFYMTWGRKNGDASNCASWPPVCTYVGMDSLLRLSYTKMAVLNNAILSPVGVVWRYLRNNYPTIELYSSDESHPTVAGTYAAACSFYASIFRKDPSLTSYFGGLDPTTAQSIQNAAKLVVYDSLQNWFVGNYDPSAEFNFTSNNLNVSFINSSIFSETNSWDFGDGSTSNELNPTHVYSNPGTYLVKLIVSSCNYSDTITKEISITSQTISEENSSTFKISPNPCTNTIQINFKSQLFNVSFSYKIINQLGQNMMIGEFKPTENGDCILDISTLPQGIYSIIIKDKNNQKRCNHKVIKL